MGWFIVLDPGWRAEPRPRLCPVDALPRSLGGPATSSTRSSCCCRPLGIDNASIIAGLCEFGSKVEDNPDPAPLWSIERPDAPPLRVLLDFAHNLAGIEAGERSDEDLRNFGAALTSLHPRRVILCEQPAYARARAHRGWARRRMVARARRPAELGGRDPSPRPSIQAHSPVLAWRA